MASTTKHPESAAPKRVAKPKTAAMAKPARKAANLVAGSHAEDGGPPDPLSASHKTKRMKAAVTTAKKTVDGVRPRTKALRDAAAAKGRQAALVGRSQLNMKG